MLSTLKINFYRFLTLVISFGLLLLSPGAQQFVIAQTESSEYEQALERLDLFMEKLEELRSHIDRTQFDVEELSFELAFEDPETIVDWVRNNIYFEQYLGLLRGAQGTLMSRAGNALDQAVLLQKILSNAGYETQIARGSLSDEQAQLLIQQMTVPREPEPALGDIDAIKQIMFDISEVIGTPTEEVETLFEEFNNPVPIETTEIYKNAQEDADFIISMLEEAGVELGDPEAMDKLLEESKDYFWLEYRVNTGDNWQAAHPVFHDASMIPNELETSEVFTDTIPESLQHRFRFQVFIEQKINDEIEAKPLIAPWERSAAELTGKPIIYINYPDSLVDFESFQGLENSMENANFFAPILNGAVVEGGNFFDLEGNVIDPVTGSSELAGVHQETGSLAGDAAGFISVLGQDENTTERGEDFITFTGQWIEYILISPNGEETKHRRTVIDRIGIDNRVNNFLQIANPDDKFDVFKSLTQEHTFMLGTGKLSQGFILNQLLSNLISFKSVLAVLIAQKHGIDIDSEFDLSFFEEVNTSWQGHFSLYSTFDQNLFANKNILAYRSEPNLITYQRGLGIGGDVTIQEVVDIVGNTRRTFEIKGENLHFNTKNTIELGVWETHAEGQFFTPNAVEHLSTMIVFDKAKIDNVPIVVLQSKDGLEELELSKDTKHFIEQDIDNGYIVLAPEHSKLAGWWRINPRTGQALGMAGAGRGSAYADYLLLFRLVTSASFTVLCAKGVQDSDSLSDSAKGAGILACAISGGIGLSGIVGSGTGNTVSLIKGIISDVLKIFLTNLDTIDSVLE